MTQLSFNIPDTVDEQVAAIDAQIAKLQAGRGAVQRTRLITCYHCKAQTPIASLTYIQTRWYEQPHGCTGGDRWHDGEGEFVCPSCNGTNRIPHEDETNAITLARSPHAGLAKLNRYFGAVVKRHDR